jgi:predicted porin
MQKKIIALAIAAAFSAPAFADTTVYGLVDATLASVSAEGQKSDLQVLSSGLSGSRLGVKSVQDAGDLKAVAVVEYALDNTTAASVGAARQQMVALAGGFGTFATGYLQTTGYDWAVKFDPTSGSAVSPLQSVTMGGNFLVGTKAGAARAQRALAYISPDLGGVTVAVNYSTALAGLGDLTVSKTAAVQSKSTAYLLSATYAGGPLTVGGVYVGATAGTSYLAALAGETSTLSATEYALGASYDLTVVKLFATFQGTKTGTNNIVTKATDNKAYSFSLVAPVGPGAVVFSYAKNKVAVDATVASLSHVGTGAALTGNQSASGLAVAWLQGLSKTTTFYAGLQKMSQGANTANYSVLNNAVAGSAAADWVKGGGSSTAMFAGLQNKF